MRPYTFFAPVHVDRFEAMASLLGENPPVTVEMYAAQGDIVLFYMKGEAATAYPLDQAFRKVRNMLLQPVVEEGQDVSTS